MLIINNELFAFYVIICYIYYERKRNFNNIVNDRNDLNESFNINDYYFINITARNHNVTPV